MVILETITKLEVRKKKYLAVCLEVPDLYKYRVAVKDSGTIRRK